MDPFVQQACPVSECDSPVSASSTECASSRLLHHWSSRRRRGQRQKNTYAVLLLAVSSLLVLLLVALNFVTSEFLPGLGESVAPFYGENVELIEEFADRWS